MPGVPSSRGCVACRKQKKKCCQSKPACSRCARLKIPCEGGGQKRYTFKNQTPGQALSLQVRDLVSAPSNEVSILAKDFTSKLEIRDLRYDLRIYGPFFTDIPRRLGTNRALDASVRAMTTAFTSFHTRQESVEMYETYLKALKALRMYLSDPEKAQEPNTMCAVYLMVICQGWIGKKDDPHLSHGELMACLLNQAASKRWKGSFDTEMLVTMCVLVILFSFVNPRIQLDPRIWDNMPEHFGPASPADESSTIESLKLRNLAKLAPLFRDPDVHASELQSAYRCIRDDCMKMKLILASLPGDTSDTAFNLVRFLEVRFQSSYGTLLTVAIMLNATLRVHENFPTSSSNDLTFFVDETIELSDKAAKYRPLGSSSIPLCLVAGWSGTEDQQKRRDLEERIANWQTDFASSGWMDLADYIKQLQKKGRGRRTQGP